MKKTMTFFIVLSALCFGANAEYSDLDNALRATYMNCVGIDDALHDMKVKAGINTAVTGVGTGLGVGAVATGIAKSNVDKELEQKFEELRDLTYIARAEQEEATGDRFKARVKQRLYNLPKSETSDEQNQKRQQLIEKSKKLGDWRTGLLAGNTATNIAGAAIAGTNKVNQSLHEQIDNCKMSVKDLKNAIARAKFNGEDVSEAKEIADVCGNFEYVDLGKIDKRATGGMASSIVGAGTGVVGTITSALANSNKIRNDDTINGQQKEKNLNTSANVFAVGSTVASATATIFNAAQIKAIKDVAEIASKCTEVLK